MHVAHFIQRYPPALGGSEAYFERLTNYLASCGETVDVWTSSAVELSDMWSARSRIAASVSEPPPGVRVRRYSPLVFPGRRWLLKALSLVPIRSLQAVTLPCNPVCPGLWRDAAQYDGPLDLVHATAFPYSFPIACGLKLARRRKVPFALTPFLHLGDPHDDHDPTRRQYTQPVLRGFLQQADVVFVQTQREREAVQELGIEAERVTLHGLGVEPAEVTGGNRAAARERWGITEPEIVVGHLANASFEKGTVDLLTAIRQIDTVRGKHLDRHLTQLKVVLAGPSMPSFESFWHSYPLKDRVVRCGPLNDTERRDFFAGIDVFCLPSRTDSFGLVLLESWVNRVPVIVYRAGGPAELVRDRVDGAIVNCDPTSLMSPLWRMATNTQSRQRMGQAGWVRATREFRWPDKLAQVRAKLLTLPRAIS